MFSPLEELRKAKEKHHSLTLVSPLTSDVTSKRKGNEISLADVGKSIQCHYMLPFWMNKNVTIRSLLGKSSAITIAVNWQKLASLEAISRL